MVQNLLRWQWSFCGHIPLAQRTLLSLKTRSWNNLVLTYVYCICIFNILFDYLKQLLKNLPNFRWCFSSFAWYRNSALTLREQFISWMLCQIVSMLEVTSLFLRYLFVVLMFFREWSNLVFISFCGYPDVVYDFCRWCFMKLRIKMFMSLAP